MANIGAGNLPGITLTPAAILMSLRTTRLSRRQTALEDIIHHAHGIADVSAAVAISIPGGEPVRCCRVDDPTPLTPSSLPLDKGVRV